MRISVGGLSVGDEQRAEVGGEEQESRRGKEKAPCRCQKLQAEWARNKTEMSAS